MTDLYRITRTDPSSARPRVVYGGRQRVRAIQREVRQTNAARDSSRAWVEANPDRTERYDLTDSCWKHVTLKVERAVAVEWAESPELSITS